MKNPRTPTNAAQSSLTPLDYAYRLLARRAYSERDLAEKMLAKGFTAAAVARTVERLKTQGYLNDAQFAADQAERLRERGFGPQQIRMKLAQKGLAQDTIEGALTANEPPDELEEARRFLASRFSTDALKQPKIAARACRLLLSRGYSQEVAEQIFGSGLDGAGRSEEE